MEKEEKKLKQFEKQVEKKAEEVKKKEVELKEREKKVDKKVEEIDKKVEQVKKLTLRQKIGRKTVSSAKAFKRELQKSINTALIAAFGFLIALAWRDAITEYVNKATEASPIQGTLVSAIIITIISVIGILILTSIMSKEEKKE